MMGQDESTETDHEFEEWLERLVEGDPIASEEAFAKFFPQLVRVVRVRMANSPRRDLDEEDIALSAMKSLFRGAAEGRFPDIGEPDDLWRVLFTIAVRKVHRARRARFALKRGGGELRGESVFGRPESGDDGPGINEAARVEATAAVAAEAGDLLKEVLTSSGDPLSERVVEMRLNGFAASEIAAELGVSTRTVERKLKVLRERWRRIAESQD